MGDRNAAGNLTHRGTKLPRSGGWREKSFALRSIFPLRALSARRLNRLARQPVIVPRVSASFPWGHLPHILGMSTPTRSKCASDTARQVDIMEICTKPFENMRLICIISFVTFWSAVMD